MSRKLSFILLLLLVSVAMANALDTSPGWTYGGELGIARGDNAGSKENLAPMGRGFVQLQMLDFLQMRIGLGYTRLHAAGDTYTSNTFNGDSRLILSPWYDK